MSQESSNWLNNNTLIGYTEQRGHAWHYREDEQGAEPNHYPQAIPVEDVLRRLFPWRAIETKLFVCVNDEYRAIPERKAIVRSDTFETLGVFKDGYTPHQYPQWLVQNVKNLLDADLGIGSAGLLRNGAQAWVSVEVPESISTPEGVVFRPNLIACTSFDGSLATTYKRVVQLVVCDNTLATGLSEKGQQFKLKHTGQSGLKIAAARDALAIIHADAADFAAEVKRLCETPVTPKQWASTLNILVPSPEADASARAVTLSQNKRDQLALLYAADPRVAPWKGTAFGVLQAFNTYTHHNQTVKGAARSERNMSNAITGKTAEADALVLATLQQVLVGA